MEEYYPYFLSIHIIFVVCWMAGLFYMVRLFIYHTEAQVKPEPDRTILSKQFEIMESKLWWIITTPSMYLVIAAACSNWYVSDKAFLAAATLDARKTYLCNRLDNLPFHLPK
jgi:uncharacterized integral membrane protein (TIGR00701 family)